MQLTNSVAIVTGGASGLGFATAQAFIAKGARVALFDLNEETGAAAAKELGENARFCRVNVSDEASVPGAVFILQ